MANISSFIATMRGYGLSPPDHIDPGRIHRFPGVGKGSGNKAGWCRLFPDGRGGVFGDFASNLQVTWHDRLSYRDKAQWLAELRATERQARIARVASQATAAEKAGRVWNQSRPAQKHPYLTRKDIEAHGVREDRHGNLVVPVFVESSMTSLQFIKPDGVKRFLSGGKVAGGYFLIGEVAQTLLLCEGFATGATLHQETGHAVCCAFNVGNLVEVGRQTRQRHPRADILICADNDTKTPGNPGVTYGRKAAAAARAELIYPDFTGLSPGSDFNDYVLAGGELCL